MKNIKNDPFVLQICISGSWGGLEMVAFETAQRMAEKGRRCLTFCPLRSPLFERLKAEGLDVEGVHGQKYFSPSLTMKTRRHLKSQGGGVVLVHQLRDLWLIRPALLGLKNTRLIGIAHVFLSVRKKDLLHRFLYSRLDSLICLTETQKRNLLLHLPLRDKQTILIPNGVDMRKFNPSLRNDSTRLNLGAGQDEVLIGVIGRLDGQKGQLEMVEAARILVERGYRFKLVFVGEETINTTGTKEKLEKKIQEYDLREIVTLVGYRRDMPEIFASLDIFVMPSYAETFGRVLIEAMASKTAVIATASGGVIDIVDDGLTGLLVPPRDPEALAQAIARYLDDPALRHEMADHAFTKVSAVYANDVVERKLDEAMFTRKAAGV